MCQVQVSVFKVFCAHITHKISLYLEYELNFHDSSLQFRLVVDLLYVVDG